MTLASGIVANVELPWLAPSKLARTVLVGSERMVTYSDGAADQSLQSGTEIVLDECDVTESLIGQRGFALA